MSGKTDKDVPGSDAEGPGQGGETPAARYAAARNTTALSPVQERLRRQQELSQRILEAAREEGQASPDFQTASQLELRFCVPATTCQYTLYI